MTSRALDRRAALLALAAIAAACRSGGGAPADGGVAPGRERVVSLSPSTTEAVFALGAGGQLVGRSRYCDWPPEVSRLPAVGGFADPSLEAIMGLAPTLVVGARGPAGPVLEKTLRARGIATSFPETESLAQIEAMLVELGHRLGRDEAAAEVVASIHARRDAVARAVAGRPPVRTLFLFDVGPIVAAGPGSFPDELVRLAGGANVVDRGGAYPTLGIERVIALDPDVILDAAAAAHGIGAGGGAPAGVGVLHDAPGWRELRAVKQGRVRAIDTSVALRPGPRIGEGLAVVARALHEGLAIP
jgi:iron complex transport system substrate-binding protein